MALPQIYTVVQKKVDNSKLAAVQVNPNSAGAKSTKDVKKPAAPATIKTTKVQRKRRYPFVSRLKVSSL